MILRNTALRGTALAFALVTLPAVAGWAATRPTIILHGRASADRAGAVRVYIMHPGGDEASLVAMWQRLQAAGAFHGHVFLPDLILCKVPPGVDAASVAGPGAIVRRADELRADEHFGLRTPPQAVEKAYQEERARDESGPEATAPERAPPPGVALDQVRRLPPELLTTGPSPVSGAGGEREIWQNSEILAGSVLIQIVLPETHFSSWVQQWPEAAIELAKYGVFQAADEYEDEFPNAQLTIFYRVYAHAPTSYYPINHDPLRDYVWIADVMNNLGYLGGPGDWLQMVHTFNNAARTSTGADWVFTIFICNALADFDHMFRDTRYVSWSYLGGPYIVLPYPPGDWPQGPDGVRCVVRHEIGHMFWAVEEDQGPASECDTRSGYLNVPNKNKTLSYSPYGGRQGCGDNATGNVEPCYMNAYDAITLGYDYQCCKWTAGMMGVSDTNENGVPDALDIPPTVDFHSADVETVTTSVSELPVTVRAEKLPNLNSQQPVDARRDVGAPLKDISVAVGGLKPYTVIPSDIGSDGLVANFVVPLPPMIPGITRVTVIGRNTYNATSPARTKTYLYVDIDYRGFELDLPSGAVHLQWTTRGELFDARVDLHRVDVVTDKDVIVAPALQPVGPPAHGIYSFDFTDRTAVPTRVYTYYVRGTIDLPYRGGTLHRVIESKRVTTRAAVPRAKAVSLLAPNPFHSETWISLDVPLTGKPPVIEPNGTAGNEKPIHVKITVYDVLGRRVATVVDRYTVQPVHTLRWDGTNENGTPMPSGMYFFRIQIGKSIELRKALLLR